MYNLTNMTSANNVYDLFSSVNSLSNGFYGLFILLIVFIVSFAFMKNFDTKTAFIASSFITAVIAVGLFFLGFIAIYGLLIPILLLIASIMVKIFGEEE